MIEVEPYSLELLKPYSWVFDDGGRSKASRKPKHKNDCVARALAITTGTRYAEALAALIEDGGASMRFANADFDRFLHALEWQERGYFGFKFELIGFPAKRGIKRVTVSEFCENYREGKYMVQIRKHIFSLVEGIVRDTWQPRINTPVMKAWKVIAP